MSTSVNNNAYVLMRTKLQFGFHWLFRKKYRFFRDAIESVSRQEYEKVTLVILQDCWWRISDRPRMRKVPKLIREILQGNSSVEVLFYSCNSHGAAHSLYNIREVLFRLSTNDDDIAIMLDDDDMFAYSNALGNIIRCMNTESAKVCITQFETIGKVSMNIVNRGGERHNQLVKQKDLKTELGTPFGKGSLCFADSLGWTKAYRVGLLKEYHNDLRSCFKSEFDLVKFICRNDAFEDFPEIINLCRKERKAVGLDMVTHAYRKHKGSITANPSKRDFIRKRPAYLALLMKLYSRLSERDKLQPEAKLVIARYLVVKILTIENILAKYRDDDNLTWSLSKFERGDFMRLMLATLKKEGQLEEFTKILKEVNYLGIEDNLNAEYAHVKENIGEADSPFMELYHACWNEAVNGKVDLSNAMCDKSVRHRVNLLKQRSYRYVAIGVAYVGITPIMWNCLQAWFDASDLSALSAVLVPFFGWLYSVLRRERDKAEERNVATHRFRDSVIELCRHIEAGLCVLYNIKCEMEAKENPLDRPAKIHFTNLKVLSQLSSSEFDDNMIIDEFSNLPHLRVNIRNIDNSAGYMEEYVTSVDYDAKKMREIIDWEIVRYISYIASLKYFTYQKSFVLPSVNQLILFVRFADIINEISMTIKRDDKTKEKIRCDIESYYKRFLDDRQIKREILSA